MKSEPSKDRKSNDQSEQTLFALNAHFVPICHLNAYVTSDSNTPDHSLNRSNFLFKPEQEATSTR